MRFQTCPTGTTAALERQGSESGGGLNVTVHLQRSRLVGGRSGTCVIRAEWLI